MKIRVTVEMDFGERPVNIPNAANVVRNRVERHDRLFYFTRPGDPAPLARIVAAWEVERPFIPTVEPGA